MQVVILAGGLGTRLRPITEKITKVMVEVNGKPFLEHQLQLLQEWGFRKFLLLVSYLGHQVEDYFGSGKKWEIEIDYSYEKIPLGTGGALKLASSKLEDRFLLLNGDTCFPLNFDDFLKRTQVIDQGGLIAVYDNHEKVAPNNIKLDVNNRVVKYSRVEEKDMNGVDGGVSFYCKTVLEHIPEGQKVSLEEEIYPKLIKKGLLEGTFTKSRYYDMGTFERLKEAQRRFVHK